MAVKKKRKSSKDPLTIKSAETKILFGIILAIIGLIILISPFFSTQTKIFTTTTQYLGYSAISWGIFVIYISFFLFFKKKSFISKKQAIGIFIFSLCLSILLTFWLPEEKLTDSVALQTAAGTLGSFLHIKLHTVLGGLIEIIIVLVLLVIAVSLISGTTLEQIRDFIEMSIPEKDSDGNSSSLRDFFKRLSPIDKDDGNIEITGVNKAEDIQQFAESNDNNDRNGDNIQINREEEGEDLDNVPTASPRQQQPSIKITDNSGSIEADSKLLDSKPKYTNWEFPSVDILQKVETKKQDEKLYKEKALIIERTLQNFGIQAKVIAIAVGPTVLRFSLSISMGTKVSKVKNLSNDLALALASQSASLRIEAPIPGTSYIGIEIPNPTPNYVYTREMIQKVRMELNQDPHKYELPMILGKDITGKTIVRDLAKIPHLLVAGATGTGKSVGINSILAGLLMTKTPDEVKFIMVDPKMGVEMGAYAGIPHLLTPVITDMELVPNALDWAINEMMRRYRQLKQVQVKKLTEYNAKIGYTAMPYIVIVIDEMADLMLTSAAEVETKIQRLAQMGRAVGIHLILATQKPTVNVITGLIKSNIPGRMAFAVATLMDSRVILDDGGAEALLGNGDMLFVDQTMPKAIRIQCTYTSTEDTVNITDKIKEQVSEDDLEYSKELTTAIEKGKDGDSKGASADRDPEFKQALEIVIANQKASSSFLERKMRIGYNKAARLIDQLYEAGAIGGEEGSKPRKVLVTSVDQILGKDSSQDDDDF